MADRASVPEASSVTTAGLYSGNTESAGQLASNAIRLNPDYPKIYNFFLGQVEFELKRYRANAKLAVSFAEATDDSELLLRALESLAAAKYQVGEFKSVRQISERLLEIARAEKNLRFEIIGCYQLVITYYYLLEFERAIEISALPVELGITYGAMRQALLANEYLARLHLDLGDLAKAREHAESSLEIAQTGQMRARESLSLIKLSEVELREGRHDKAVELATKALECVDEAHLKPWAIPTKAQALSNASEASDLLARAEDLMSPSSTSSHYHFHVRVIQMDVGLRHRNWTAIDQAADRLEQYTKKERMPWTDFHIDRGRAIAQWGRGETDENYETRLAAFAQHQTTDRHEDLAARRCDPALRPHWQARA